MVVFSRDPKGSAGETPALPFGLRLNVRFLPPVAHPTNPHFSRGAIR